MNKISIKKDIVKLLMSVMAVLHLQPVSVTTTRQAKKMNRKAR